MADLFRIAGGLVIDSTTAADPAGLPLCTFPIVSGTALYQVSDKILETRRLQLASQNIPLTQLTVKQADVWDANWLQRQPGPPQVYITDYQTGYYLMVPTPDANDTANLTNSLLPLVPLSFRNKGAILPFREEYHKDLIPGILSLAFQKGAGIIPDTYKPDLAAFYEAQFQRRADEIKTEIARRNRGTHTNRIVRGMSAK